MEVLKKLTKTGSICKKVYVVYTEELYPHVTFLLIEMFTDKKTTIFLAS